MSTFILQLHYMGGPDLPFVVQTCPAFPDGFAQGGDRFVPGVVLVTVKGGKIIKIGDEGGIVFAADCFADLHVTDLGDNAVKGGETGE